LRERLKPLGDTIVLPRQDGDGPAMRFRLPNAQGELGIISALSSHFCDTCNRLRINSAGQVVPCLFSEPVADLKALLSSHATDQELAQALLDAAAKKPRRHDQTALNPMASGCAMSSLGG
jgi:cyclic pyranopterin phosphate synthase